MSFNQFCWDFLEDEDPSYPILPLYIKNPEFEDNELLNDFKFDNGFAGTIGINDKIIDNLQLQPIGATQIITTIGAKNVPYYHLYIKNHEWDLGESLVLAIKTTRLLIGRSVMKNKQFLLDFKNSNFCYLKDRT